MKNILILGSGCSKCNTLHEATKQAVEEINLDCKIEKITDMMKFADYGVMITPALVVDGKLKVAGRIPTADEIKKFISE